MAGKDTPDENAAHVKMQVLPVWFTLPWISNKKAVRG